MFFLVSTVVGFYQRRAELLLRLLRRRCYTGLFLAAAAAVFVNFFIPIATRTVICGDIGDLLANVIFFGVLVFGVGPIGMIVIWELKQNRRF